MSVLCALIFQDFEVECEKRVRLIIFVVSSCILIISSSERCYGFFGLLAYSEN